MRKQVTEADVRHVAALARLGLDAARIPALARELDAILDHMTVLSRVKTEDVQPVTGVGAGGTPLRADDGEQYPLAGDRAAFAPAMRDGFFLVPRLASHGGSAGAGGPATGAAPADEPRAPGGGTS